MYANIIVWFGGMPSYCSLDFVKSRLFMKLFKTSDMEIVKYCHFVITSVEIATKSEQFVKNLTLYMNVVYDDISVNLCCKLVL